MASTAKGKNRRALPAGTWHVEEARWGESQRVRLITGPPSLVGDLAQVRSIHIAAFFARQDAQNVVWDDVLLVENKDGTWTFPGGRLEANETLEEALAREVWEEARAVIAPASIPVAATRIEFLNRVPGRVYRVHPTYLLWVAGRVTSLSDEPHHDPADGVVGRRIATLEEARGLLAPLEQSVLNAVLALERK